MFSISVELKSISLIYGAEQCEHTVQLKAEQSEQTVQVE